MFQILTCLTTPKDQPTDEIFMVSGVNRKAVHVVFP